MTAAWTQCRYLRRSGEQCTAEAVVNTQDAPVVLCSKHLSRAVDMVSDALRRKAKKTTAGPAGDAAARAAAAQQGRTALGGRFRAEHRPPQDWDPE